MPQTETEWQSWASDMELRMARVEEDLRDNTEKTSDIHELLMNARGFFNMLSKIGTGLSILAKLVAACGALWAAFLALKNGKLPGV